MKQALMMLAVLAGLTIGSAGSAQAQEGFNLGASQTVLQGVDPALLLQTGTALLSDPARLGDTGLNILEPVAIYTLPVTGVLFTNPAGLAGFVLGGGTLVTPSIPLLPAIPLISAPLR